MGAFTINYGQIVESVVTECIVSNVDAELNLDKVQCENICSYFKTRFARFMHSLAKSSQDATSKTFQFVPLQDFSEPWTDEKLYAKYGITPDEQAYVESLIKPME